MDIDGVSLSVERIVVTTDDPLRPCLVFLHDSLGSIETWRDFPRVLAERVGLNAIVYDRRGHGKSDPFPSAPRTPDYLDRETTALFALLDGLGETTAILFGHSDGGSIPLIAAARAPKRIVAIVTEGAHVVVEEETLAGIRAAAESFLETDLRERLARYHGTKVDALASAWIDTWLSSEFRHWSILELLPRIVCPALIIQGEDDEFGTADQVRTIVESVSGPAQGLLLPNAAHTPHREARDVTLSESANFIAEALSAWTSNGDSLAG